MCNNLLSVYTSSCIFVNVYFSLLLIIQVNPLVIRPVCMHGHDTMKPLLEYRRIAYFWLHNVTMTLCI